MNRALPRRNDVIRCKADKQRNEEAMIRRKFLQLVALSGAGALAPLEGIAGTAAVANANAKGKTAVFQVKGFSCVTCAVGLDTMFSRTEGIVSCHSTYPEGKVTVRFDPGSIDEAAVRAVITDAGFTIASEHTA
jgi:copper chaperone CopZ